MFPPANGFTLCLHPLPILRILIHGLIIVIKYNQAESSLSSSICCTWLLQHLYFVIIIPAFCQKSSCSSLLTFITTDSLSSFIDIHSDVRTSAFITGTWKNPEWRSGSLRLGRNIRFTTFSSQRC